MIRASAHDSAKSTSAADPDGISSCDVLVVGGGPAGASTATVLARAGVDVVIVDRAHFPRPKPCAEYLSPEASRILQSMGALDRVELSGAALLAGIIIRAPNGRTIRGEFNGQHRFRGYRDRGLSVRREVLDLILLDSARSAGARVIEGRRVADLERETSGRVVGASVLDADARRRLIRARLVIGADGLRSTVAQRLGLATAARWPRRLALVTHYRGVAAVGELAEMHVERDGYVGIADVGNGVTTVALVVPLSRAKASVRDRSGFLEQWIRARAHLAPRFATAERVSPVVATGPFGSRARHATTPGALLVGDAADFFDPFTGEGIYSALRGGELAAECAIRWLAATTPHGERTALDAYEEERRIAFGGKWTVERVIGAVVGSPTLMNRAARALSTRRDLADILVGVTGNFIPATEVLTWRYVLSAFGVAVPSFGSAP